MAKIERFAPPGNRGKATVHEQVLPVVRYLALSISRVPKEQAAIVQLNAYPL